MTSYDIIISGAGLAGLMSAHILGQAGLHVALISSASLPTQKHDVFDGRATALSYKNVCFMNQYGLGDMVTSYGYPIKDIRIVDQDFHEGACPLFVHFSHKESGILDSNNQPAYFGYMVENTAMIVDMAQHVINNPLIDVIEHTDLVSTTDDESLLYGHLSNGVTIQAALLIAAEGKHSSTRKQHNIDMAQHDYKQHAILTTIQAERDHGGVALEAFCAHGPFAMLPLKNRMMNIVWTEHSTRAHNIMSLSDDDFLRVLQQHTGDWLGNIQLCTKRFSYPIKLIHNMQYYSGRCCFIADSAHSIHPVAGQGFNLGIQDIAALCNLVIDYRAKGLDIGHQHLLQQYQRLRYNQNQQIIMVCDSLIGLFSNNNTALTLLRRAGLGMVQHMPMVKKLMMRRAMGV